MMKKYGTLKLLIILLIAFFAVPLLKEYYLRPNTVTGEGVKDFSGTLADGSAFNLADLRGRYVLLDFWGSWCGPCIAEMPQIKALHEQFGQVAFREAAGFTIVSVAVEKDETRWRRALERHLMPWKYQLMDTATSLKFFDSPIAERYGVKQLPTKFLINEKGVVIGVDQSFEEIAAFLESKRKG